MVLGMYDSQPGPPTRFARGRWVRAAAGLAAAALLVGGGAVIGAHLSGGSGQATVTTRLASSETISGVTTSALGTSLLGSQAVANAVKAAKVETSLSEITMIASTYTKLEGTVAAQMIRLLEALEDLDDVQNVYSNFDLDATQYEEVAG